MAIHFEPISEALSRLHVPGENTSPITVVATETIRSSFDEKCLEQAINSRLAPGVTDLVLNPDAHAGYGAPVGCVLVSPTHIYPGPVGVDIKCSMSLLQLDLPAGELKDKRERRAVIDAILARTPTGPGKGQRNSPKSRKVSKELGLKVVTEGASPAVCQALGIPPEWALRCEDSAHTGHDGTSAALAQRMEEHLEEGIFPAFIEKIQQLGSYGGGNHFGEANTVRLSSDPALRSVAERFGLKEGSVAFLSHCGSRGFGYVLASNQFRMLQQQFKQRGMPFPGNDRELVYAPLGSPQADAYLDDMALGANFATVNHLLINALILEAFQEVIPGTTGELVYFISHNIARKEEVNGVEAWVHRKGATRAFPAKHPALQATPFFDTGHPILLPGNPKSGSAVMVALPGAEKSCFSVNHGAGRAMGRKAAYRALNQKEVDSDFERCDILSNCRQYPLDEAPAAYKDFFEVLRSVETAGLAKTVASLKANFVIKDHDKSLSGAA